MTSPRQKEWEFSERSERTERSERQIEYALCQTVFDFSSTSRIAYVTITIISEDSTNPCLFQQCASDVNDVAYVTGA